MINMTRDNWIEIKYSDIEKHISVDGNLIKLPNKNQIFPQVEFNETEQRDMVIWILEQYEGLNEYKGNGEELYSVFDGFETLEEAIKYGLLLSERTHEKIRNEILANKEDR